MSIEQRREGMFTHHTDRLLVHAIDSTTRPAVVLQYWRRRPWQLAPFVCRNRRRRPAALLPSLRRAGRTDHADFPRAAEHPSVWREVGSSHIHATPCEGYPVTGRLPERLPTGPGILRTYQVDDTMNCEHTTVVTDEPVCSR